MSRVAIKICGITREEDARLAIELGVDALGFNFHPASPRCVPPEVARHIVAQLPRGLVGVGVFVDAPAEQVRRVARQAGLGCVQLHGNEPPQVCAALEPLEVWKALPVGEDFDPSRLAAFPCRTFVLDAPGEEGFGGGGRTFDWSRVARSGGGVRIFVAGGLTPDNVAAAIAALRPHGVDVASGVERAPGIKDPERMRRFVAAVRAAERALEACP